jgi:putative tryptophan/tyrosine transport system substrate-binding protein
MRRREVITLLGGAAAAWPMVAHAQQPAMPMVGFMSSGSPGPLRRQLAAVHEGLREAGYVDGQNVVIDFRFAEGQFDRFPTLAADLVQRQVAVLMVTSNAGALAAKKTTTRSQLSSPSAPMR